MVYLLDCLWKGAAVTIVVALLLFAIAQIVDWAYENKNFRVAICMVALTLYFIFIGMLFNA